MIWIMHGLDSNYHCQVDILRLRFEDHLRAGTSPRRWARPAVDTSIVCTASKCLLSNGCEHFRNTLMSLAYGIVQWRAAPTIARARSHAFAEQPLDNFHVTIRRGEMKRCSAVIVTAGEVSAANFDMAQRVQIIVCGCLA